jgi:inner membrane protein
MGTMNRQIHIVIGLVFFLLYLYGTAFFHGTSPELIVLGLVAVAAGSLFPDVLEPATTAKHRGFFHSRLALKVVVVLFLLTAILVLVAPGIPDFVPVFCSSCFLLGYAVHLLADSLTKAGLPR